MVTDLAAVRRLAKSHEAQNLRFRRYLRTHHISDRPLRVIAGELLDKFDCKTCANCCRQTRVVVSKPEIDAIAQHLEMKPAEVTRLYTIQDKTSQETSLRQENDACVFLHNNTCLVYEARPRACRNFPAVAGNKRLLGSRMSSVCRQTLFCPVVYTALEEFKTLTGYRDRTR